MTTDSRSFSEKPLEVAFLGGGIDSAVGVAHRTAIEMDRRFKLVAGCFSRSERINFQSAAQYGISGSRTYGDLESLIISESGKIDVIVILTPTDQHMEQVVKCLVANIPVICEKALATSFEDAKAIQAILEKKGGFLSVIYNYTGYPVLRDVRRMIRQSRFGKILQVQVEMPQEGFARVDQNGKPVVPQDWRLHDVGIPVISLDLGVHLHILVHFLTGEEPMEVVASSDSLGNFRQVIDNVSCIARYSGNLHCNYWFSKMALGYRNGLKIRIYGEKMSAEWLQENPEHVLMADNTGKRFILDRASPDMEISTQNRYTRFKAGHPAGFIEAFANYYYDVADSLEAYLTGEISSSEYAFGIQETLEGLALFEAVAKSSVQEKWIKIIQEKRIKINE